MLVKHKSIDGMTLGYLGSLNDLSLIVVIGRSNYKKSSESLDALVKALHASGHSVCWFENRQTQTAKLLEDKFERLWGSRVSKFCKHNFLIGNLLRKTIKIFVLLAHPTRWGYFLTVFKNSNQRIANDLRKFLRHFPARRIYLFSHSAGGIVSSLAEAEDSVTKLVCFGYPFKHPDQDEEPSRTARLKKMIKPFLIIQGDQDEYGSAQDSKRYKLSSSISVVPIQAEHGYDNLSVSEYQKCLELLEKFLTLP